MAVMKSTSASRQNRVVSGYTPIKKNNATVTKRRAYAAVIKRSNPINTTPTKVSSTPVITPEAKLASATTAFKSALDIFDSALSSISGSFPSEYQKAIKEAITTINAATTAINATVEVAKLPPPSQVVSPPVSESLSPTIQPLSPANDLVPAPQADAVTPVGLDNGEETRFEADYYTISGLGENALPPVNENVLPAEPARLPVSVEGISDEVIEGDVNSQVLKTAVPPSSYDLANYLVLQDLHSAQVASDEIRQQLSVVV